MESSLLLYILSAGAALAVLVASVVLYKVFSRPKKFLPREDFCKVPLIDKKVLSHDTRQFTFALPLNNVLGLPTGQHVSLKFIKADGTSVQRSYTPVSDDSSLGLFRLVIKVYEPLPPKFPTGGQMSQHLDSLQIGDTILMRGPKGHVHYDKPGHVFTKPLGKPREERACQQIGMMAGGTGITPMLQILHAIFTNPNDTTIVKLIYANQTQDDILCRDELEALHDKFGDRLQVWYTVDRVVTTSKNNNWKYDTGFITKSMIEQHLLFENGNKSATQFFMCGPPPMIKFACLPALQELGYSEKDWIVF